ncbi:MAG: sigma-70 family RNA polymerase sigma factor [Clostridiales bacterium]|nr:sigma-70 family RNA polymerase sigma factor [Clostridiales bacterium]
MTEFEKVYRMYFKDVFLYIMSISGDEQIAEDIISETFLKALESINGFKGNCDIRVWLCQIAKNTYYSYMRKKKKYSVQELPIEIEDKVNIEQSVLSAEASMEAHKILNNLEEPYKEVFTLRIFGELSFKQIASLFGKTENWACVTFHRAKKKIQERMEDYL